MLDSVLFIIPARGNSKGIPNKNEKMVGGKPLISYSIEYALNSKVRESHIVVSSDKDSILDIARQYNVQVRLRPTYISGDNSPTEDAMLDVLNWYKNDVSHVCLMQPTSPIRLPRTLFNCFSEYFNGEYDSLLTATKLYNFFWKENCTAYQQIFNTGPRWKPVYNPTKRPMRQKLTKKDYLYFENGNIYITNTQVLRKTKCRIGNNPCVYFTHPIEGLQIDDIEDMNVISKIIKYV